MKHIALIIPGLDRLGGAERQVMLLARGLRRRGWRVTVIALSGCGVTAAEELRNDGIGFVTLQMRKGLADPRGWWRFHRWLRREQPDVVHAHLPHAAWLGRCSRLFAPIPRLIDTLHSSATGGPGRRMGYRLSARLPDGVTAVSVAAADAHLRAGMARAENLVIVPNGIDVDAFQPDEAARNQLRRELGLRDEFLWLAVGRLEPVKNYPAMLSAMSKLPDRARLFIAGSGPLESDLRALAERLGLAGRMRLLGFVPDAAPWMQAADGFVLSSLWEGLPMALLEAAACALPAVACDAPGVREAVVEGQTGWLVRAGDPAALTAGMSRLMNVSPLERRAIGANARRRVVQQFAIETILDRWEQLYTQQPFNPRGPSVYPRS